MFWTWWLRGTLASALGCMAVACVTANDGQATLDRAEAAPPKPFLYSVESSGEALVAAQTVAQKNFLFGTVHVAIDARRDLPLSVWRAFTASPCFIMEADVRAIDQERLATMAAPPAGQSLKAILPVKTWDRLVSATAPVIDAAKLDQVDVWFAALLYMQAGLPRDVRSMDEVFFDEALRTKKRIFFLEEWSAALVAFKNTINKADLVAMVDENAAAQQEELDAILTAYRSGDEKKLGGVLEDESRRGLTPESAERSLKALLDDRNAAWMPRLIEDLLADRCFVAVGAGHLLGDRGLLRQLAGKGFAVRREPAIER